MVTITTGKFVSIEGGRGILHVVFIEPCEDMGVALSLLEVDSFDL